MELPPIKQLIEESWHIFVKSILNLFIVNIVVIVAFFALFVVVLIVGLLLGFDIFQGFALPTAPIAIVMAIILGVVAGICVIALSVVYHVASVMVVDEYNTTISFPEVFKRSFGLILPSLLVGLLVMLCVFGGFMVFFLPGIIFAYLLMLAWYEVILHNQRGMTALKRSLAIVTHSFGGILIRYLVLVGIYLLIAVFIPNIILKIEPATGIIIMIFSFFTNFLVSLYMLVYGIVLYKHARTLVADDAVKSVKWLWIVSIIGWVFAIIVVFSTYKIIASGVLNSVVNQQQKKLNYYDDFRRQELPSYPTYIPSQGDLKLPPPRSL